MRQRLQIARGLVNDPSVLLLDEPTIGLDPHIARDLRAFIREQLVRKQGKTVLLTTHYMYEAEELCDRVAIIDRGQIVALDTPEKLKDSVSKEISLILTLLGDTSSLELLLKKADGVTAYSLQQEESGEVTATILAKDDRSVSTVISEMLREGFMVRRFETRKPTLEDVFIKLTSRGID
jgi:ABC-2 type transport system ATP-binding protein